MKSYFPDINVWIALAYRGHVHHSVAAGWLEQIAAAQLFFCRFTQLGFLRLLTNSRVLGRETKSQKEAWRYYDRWFDDGRVAFYHEPEHLEPILRQLTQSPQPASAAWPDAYLAAVAQAGGLTLVTLDRGFRQFEGLDLVLLASA